MYGGPLVHKVLVKLFSHMLTLCHVPKNMKVGTIITVYKGGKKDKRNPHSYRAITLSSCILKLFEKVLLRRLESNISLTHHRLPGGFRKDLVV